jgi:ribosomal-protein-alanine N-acetyltransferase
MNFIKRDIETERLILKILDKTFAEKVLDFHIRNRDFHEKWDPVRDEKYYTEEHHKKELEDELYKINKGLMFKLWLFEKHDRYYEKPLGYISFSNIVRGCFQSCHLGYKIDRDETNKGYTTEALRAGIDFVFMVLNLHRIEANIIPGNIPSFRVVEKLGFCNEGISKKYLKINGIWQDHIHMVILNEAME